MDLDMLKNRCAMLLVLFLFSLGFAQEDYLESTSGGVQVRLGLVGEYELNDLTSLINKGITKDLDFDGRFTLFNSKTVSPNWSTLGVQYYTTVKWTEHKPGYITLDLNLSDFYSGEVFFGRRYEIKKEKINQAIHDFSDEVIRVIYGTPGLNQTKLLLVKKVNGSKNIFEMKIDGSNLRQITKGEGIRTFPNWGPNFNSVIYTAFDDGIPSIYQWRYKDGKSRRLIPAGIKGITPVYDSLKNRVIYSEQGDSSSDLYAIDLKTKARTQVTNSRGNELSPSIDPNGNGIYYTWDRGFSPQIYNLDSKGEVKRLTYHGRYNESSILSPRGDKLAYCSMSEGLLNILVQDLRTGDILQLTHLQGNNESPTWSPDGRFIAFSSTRTGTSQVFIMRADGTGVVQVTSKGKNFQPRWSGYKQTQEISQ
jgi:TolB protein